MVMPSTLVGPPPRQPLPYGLFSTFSFRPTATGIRWEGAGVAYETLGCGPLKGVGFGADWCADPDTVPGLPRQFERSPGDDGEATPFAIIAAHKCSPVGNSVAAARTIAESRLAAHEERAVEYALASGVLGNKPTLRDAEALTSGPVPFDVGIGLLEEFIAAEYGSQGIIHAPRLVVAGSPQSLRQSGQTLRTVLGTPVAAGSGYDGAAPDGTAPTGGRRWVYVTPAITGYRSDAMTTDLFDRLVNDQVAYAERDYLLMFEDCGVAAVEIDAGLAGAAVTNIALPARAINPYLTV